MKSNLNCHCNQTHLPSQKTNTTFIFPLLSIHVTQLPTVETNWAYMDSRQSAGIWVLGNSQPSMAEWGPPSAPWSTNPSQALSSLPYFSVHKAGLSWTLCGHLVTEPVKIQRMATKTVCKYYSQGHDPGNSTINHSLCLNLECDPWQACVQGQACMQHWTKQQ